MDQSKIPSVEVRSDSLVITHEGVQYRPHAGESVWFAPFVSIGHLTMLLRRDTVNDPEEQAKRFDELLDVIASRIVAWNWTGVSDQTPLPNPPTKKELSLLSFNEIYWLRDRCVDLQSGGTDDPKVSSASTEVSKVTKPKRRGNG